MGVPTEQGGVTMTTLEFASTVTGLTDLEIIAPAYLTDALTEPLSDGETDGKPPFDNPEGLAASYREQKEAGRLPAHLADFDVYCARYRELMAAVPGRFGSRFDRSPPEIKQMLADTVAQALAAQTVTGEVNLDTIAGVKATRNDRQSLITAKTLTGFEVTVPADTRAVVEYGPGLAGTARRIKEIGERTWRSAYLLNRTPFASMFARQLRPRLHLLPGRVHPFSEGMADGARQLIGLNVQADMLIAAKIGSTPADELEPAIRAAYDIVTAGGALVLSDFVRYENTNRIVDIAAEHFGPPAETRYADFVTGKGRVLPMRDTVFIR
jgi:hypothetical protein